MNVVSLQGGLGNQLFQYAYGRALAERTGREVLFSLADLSRSNRMYMLDSFHVRITSNEGLRQMKVCHEPSLRFDEAFLEPPDDVELHGYWQCEQYFDNIVMELHEELMLQRTSEDSHTVAWEIRKAPNSVAVHVRRTDALHPASAHHGTPALEYYRAGVDLIERQYGKAQIFMFSDDTRWCRENLLDADTRIVDCNPMSGTVAGCVVSRGPRGREHEDLWLMSQCRHAVIANSTFSWWGAWLGRPKDTVVAPKTWFLGVHDGATIVPERWVRL